MDYQVTIKEQLIRKVLVESASAKEAEAAVIARYKAEDIVLDYSDFTGVDFKVKRVKLKKEPPLSPYYRSVNRDFTLLHGDCMELLGKFDFKFDMIFADPPYFLSNDGISFQAGKVVSVNKGEWDRGKSPAELNEFNLRWLSLCRDKLKDNGTIWISGTYNNIFSVANSLTSLGYKILNVVTWAKTNPPPNISCRYFTYSTEFVIWARKSAKVPHRFNYELMKLLNDGKQMTDVWRLPAIARWEKSCGKHPTQKPLSLLSRIILASTAEGGWILDPFAGSSTTGIAASLTGRRFLGVERERDFVEMSRRRRAELDDPAISADYCRKIKDISMASQFEVPGLAGEPAEVGYDLPF
jgi:site-specific DNA-methyltransferase (adenine-specific)